MEEKAQSPMQSICLPLCQCGCGRRHPLLLVRSQALASSRFMISVVRLLILFYMQHSVSFTRRAFQRMPCLLASKGKMSMIVVERLGMDRLPSLVLV